MKEDIVDRLYSRSFSSKCKDPLCEEAADEIKNLRLELRVLRGAMVKAQQELSLADVAMEPDAKKRCMDNCCNRCENLKNEIVNKCLNWGRA